MGTRRLRRILPAFPGSTNDAQTAEYERRDERKAREHDRVVSKANVRRGAAVALHFAAQHALGELRQSRDDVTARIDDRGHSGIGRAQHRAPGLERTHAGDLQVLARGERIAEPGDVGNIHEERRLRQLSDDPLAKSVLPADIRRDELSAERERPWIFRAPGEIRQRDRERPHHPAQAPRHEFAERDQMRLVVALRRRNAHADQAVEIASVRVADRHADKEVCSARGGGSLDVLQVERVDRVEKPRNGGLGQHDQLRAARFDQPLVGRERRRIAIRPELEVLGDVSLQQRNLEGRALRRGPGDLFQQLSEPEREYERDAARDAGLPGAGNDDAEKPHTERNGERHAVDPDDGSEARERRIHLAVADGEPGDAGEDPAAQPFKERPQGGEREQGGGERAEPQAREAPACSGRIQREDRAKGKRADRSERRRHRAEIVQADVHPGHAGAEKARAKGETDPERLSRRLRAAPEEQQDGEGQERQRERGERSKAGDAQGARGEGRDDRGAGQSEEGLQALPGSRCTWRACSLRLSPRSTWKRRPPMVIASPRFGKRPKRCSTSPPTVSKSVSENWVPKTLLKSAISVCALTRKYPLCSRTMLSSDSSKSYSSSMSPTICSSTSSMVTRPATPPYSSTTTAM